MTVTNDEETPITCFVRSLRSLLTCTMNSKINQLDLLRYWRCYRSLCNKFAGEPEKGSNDWTTREWVVEAEAALVSLTYLHLVEGYI